MARRIPPEAFYYYNSLGPGRSYQKVADHFGFSKRAITTHAKEERWQERVLEIERKAAEGATQKAIETVEAMNLRHLKASKVVQAKALETLRSLPLDSGMDAVRALDIGMRQERLIRGEPTDRSEVSVQDTIRKEFEDLMIEEDTEETEEKEAEEDGLA